MSEPQRFRTKSDEIEAIRFDGDNHDEIIAFTFGCFEAIDPADREDDPEAIAQVFYQRYGIWIPVKAGMWIARDVHGYFPIKAEDLAEKYEPADTPEIRTFIWGQSISLNRSTETVDIHFNDGEQWVGDVQIGIDDVRTMRDMLDGLLAEVGSGDE